MQSRSGVNEMGGQHTNNSNNRVGSINSNPGSTASRGSKYNIHHNQMGGGSNHMQAQMVNQNMYNIQNSQSPPSVRNKIQMHKIMKNSNQKSQNTSKTKTGQGHQYTMYQSNHMPMTSQQSRRKSQVSINNMMTNQGANVMIQQQMAGDPLHMMNFHGQMGPMTTGLGIGMHGQGGFGGMSDTGAPPDSSGGSMMNMNMIQVHPMQMYQSNFNGSSLAHY